MADVFISYAHDDREAVEHLATAIEQAGFSVWWDRQIVSGAEFSREIQQALDSARVAVVVWSKASIESHWVRDEAEHARVMGSLAAVTFDGTLPPLGFRQFQCTDLSRLQRGDTSALTPLLERIAQSLGVSAPTSLPTRAAPTKNYAWIAAAALAVFTVAGLVFFWFGAPHDQESDGTAGEAKTDIKTSAVPLANKSVAVLPFVAMSAEASDGYFADGLTEEILNALTTVPGLRVTARTSSFYFKGKNLPIPEIAEKLGVAHVLEGSLRPAGDKIRITAQLIRASDGTHLWSQTYDRERRDVFAVQSEVAERVAGVLGIFLDDKARSTMEVKGIGNADAFADFQKGAQLYYEGHAYGPFAPKAFEAQELLAKAFTAMPEFSDARLMHAVIYDRLLKMTLNGVPVAPFPERSASELQQLFMSDLAEALRIARTPQHRAMIDFVMSFSSDDWTGLSSKIDAVLSRTECLGDYGWIGKLALFGKGPEVTAFTKRRGACDPFDPGVYGTLMGLQIQQRHYAEARATIQTGREHFGPRPPYAQAEAILAIHERNFDEARRLLPTLGNDKWLLLMLALQSGGTEAPTLIQEVRSRLNAPAIGERVRSRMLLVLAAWTGDRTEAVRLAGALDEAPFGSEFLLQAAEMCLCGSPFPLDATPKFAARLKQAGLTWSPPSLPWPNKDW